MALIFFQAEKKPLKKYEIDLTKNDVKQIAPGSCFQDSSLLVFMTPLFLLRGYPGKAPLPRRPPPNAPVFSTPEPLELALFWEQNYKNLQKPSVDLQKSFQGGLFVCL